MSQMILESFFNVIFHLGEEAAATTSQPGRANNLALFVLIN
jgi:hypothetical protein